MMKKLLNAKDMPSKYTDMVGTTQTLKGAVFSANKELPETKFRVLDIRWGSGTYINAKQFIETGETDYEHPTYELLLKTKGMNRSQWSRPLPIPEINYANTESSQFD